MSTIDETTINTMDDVLKSINDTLEKIFDKKNCQEAQSNELAERNKTYLSNLIQLDKITHTLQDENKKLKTENSKFIEIINGNNIIIAAYRKKLDAFSDLINTLQKFEIDTESDLCYKKRDKEMKDNDKIYNDIVSRNLL
jgi:hypothetical protein